MNAFAAFLQGEWAERAGWTLLNSLWQIAAVAAAYAITGFLLRNRSADCRYVLGCVAILAMLGLPVGTYVLQPHDLPPAAELASSPNTPPEPAIISASPSFPVRHGDPSLAEAVPAETTIAKTITLEAPVAAQPVTTDLLSELRRFLPWITAAWLTGVLLLSLRPLWGWFHVRRLMRRGLSPLSDALRHAAQRVKRRLRVNRAVRFAQSALVEVPTVVGCLRPMILLPASAISGLSTAQIELILAHELAHVRRHDWLVNFAQTVIEALLFYHPAMWWVSNQIRKERENCCDDMAVAISNNRTTYVQALARLEEHRSAAPASVLGATGGSLLGRVRRLMGEPSGEFGSAAAGVWFLTMAFLLVGVVLTASYVQAWSQADNSPQEDPNAYVAKPPKEPAIEKKKLPREVRLPRDDAIQAVLLPGGFKYGKQSLTVHATNGSSMTQFFAPGDYPHEILVDGVTYRMARFNVGWYAIKPRPISPRSRDHGSVFSLPKTSANVEEAEPLQLTGSVFTWPKVWMNNENRKPLQLTADKHTVQAVFYLLDPDTGRRGRRVLSNAIEIGADGRAMDMGIERQPADFRDVKIRMLGGEARKPLAGLELTVSSGGTESYTATTEQDGVASIRLPHGYHRVSFTSPNDLPYLPFRTDSLYWSGDSRSIRVAETPDEQTIELVLADPCELVLRAADVDTGKGIPGVRFALESMYEEVWAKPIVDETVRARSKDRRATRVAANDQPLGTDEQGYFRRYVGPRHDEWSYWVEASPDGYRLVSPRGDVKIDTSLGKKRAEQTFLFRRRDADASKVD
jgi:beta-lactamase regulating signal transducer with metallopeptidase domain